MATPQQERAALLTAWAQEPSSTSLPPILASIADWPAYNTAAMGAVAPGCEPSRLARFGRSLARHPIVTARTCGHAAKMLPTVRRALPWYVLPIVILAAAVKCLPLDFGADEALFAVAFALVLWKRPGLLEALYREAQAGRPAPCSCERHGGSRRAREAATA